MTSSHRASILRNEHSKWRRGQDIERQQILKVQMGTRRREEERRIEEEVALRRAEIKMREEKLELRRL